MMDMVAFELLRDVLRSSGQARVRAIGSSMVPSIWPGDELVIQSISGPVLSGQIVAWASNDRMLIHRVITVSADQTTIITQGDQLEVADPPASCDQVLGVVKRVGRAGELMELDASLSWRASLLRKVARFSSTPVFALIKLRNWMKAPTD